MKIEQHSFVKNKSLKYIFLTSITIAIIRYLLLNFKTSNITPRLVKSRHRDDIYCHTIAPDHSFPLTHSLNISERSIFFIETSCHGTIDSRQACSIESAARAHPERMVNVLFAGPLRETTIREEPFKTLQNMGNVHFSRLYTKLFAKDTIVESFFARNVLSSSKYQMLHSSDVLRFLTLYKYGGVYLDLDVIVVKSFDSLPKNFVSRGAEHFMTTFVLAFSKDGIGNIVSEEYLRRLEASFDPNQRNWNGPGIIQQVFTYWCLTRNIAEMTADTCKGFQVFDHTYFGPVNYNGATTYFSSINSTLVLKEEYSHHLWNEFTHRIPRVPKTCIYSILARKFCPTIYDLYGTNFGTIKE